MPLLASFGCCKKPVISEQLINTSKHKWALGSEQPTLSRHLLQLSGGGMRGDLTGHYREAQAGLGWVPTGIKANRASRASILLPAPNPPLWVVHAPVSPPPPPGGQGFRGDAVFAPGLRASLTLSCLSVGRARSRRLPGRLLQLRVTSAPWPGERCRGRWRRWRLRRKQPELALGTPRL